ncbi:MAG: DUF6807 family protein [Micromonosporaceae bacterium]
MQLHAGGQVVASYVVDPELPATLAPRPYLHPIRTLAGVVISDALPEDHPWHLGLSLGVQDVNGTNLWGGRTYVRGQGYTWRDDHGTITHEAFDLVAEDRFRERLAWRDPHGEVLLTEERTVSATLVSDTAWALELGWALTAPARVELGSPATNGRPDGAGYGGCFLRLARHGAPQIRAGAPGGPTVGPGEDAVNGSAEPQLVWRADGYTLTCSGLGEGDRWFVRAGIYPGICAAWAFEEVRVIEAGQTWSGRFRVVIEDH